MTHAARACDRAAPHRQVATVRQRVAVYESLVAGTVRSRRRFAGIERRLHVPATSSALPVVGMAWVVRIATPLAVSGINSAVRCSLVGPVDQQGRRRFAVHRSR